jgi:pantetheine-phosphate adenylyltransferase
MALMNRHLEPNVDTILLNPSPQFSQISSSLVREIAGHGGDLAGLVPDAVLKAIRKKTRPKK